MRLEVQDVDVWYTDRPALRGVRFSLESGELVALCGPNGAGKSTVLRCVAGLVRPRRGRVVLDGHEVALLPPAERARRVGYLPQEPTSPEGFHCVEVVQLGRYAARPGWALGWTEEDRTAALAALAATDTLALANRPLQHTSGGERQRVLLARVLAQGARMLALDEPTAHLDFTHQVSVVGLLRRLAHDEGYGVLAATHDLNLASLFFDRVVLLAGGRLLAQGPPGEVLRSGTVAEAYGAAAVVISHPEVDRPVVLPRVRG